MTISATTRRRALASAGACCTLALAASLSGAPGVTRTVVATTPTMEAARIEYAPGAAGPIEQNGDDAVLVPVDGGIDAELEGAAVDWKQGIPILISRGAPHRLVNHSDHSVRFMEIRAIGDSPAGNDRVVEANGATIVRSTYGKYIRATVWRLERGARVEWTAEVDALIVRSQPPGSALATRELTEASSEVEVVRVSRMAPQ